MNIRQTLLTPVVASLLVLGALFSLIGPSPAGADVIWNSALVPVTGTVSGSPESVSFSGNATIRSRFSIDPLNTAIPPSIVLYIDLSTVSGVGLSTKKKYVITGPEIAERTVVAVDLIEIAFPFYQGGTVASSTTRPGMASFQLSFDVNTGAITSGKGAVAAPNLPQ
jgi:hypothetical protein